MCSGHRNDSCLRRESGLWTCGRRGPSRLWENYCVTVEIQWSARLGQQENTATGCSKRPDFSPAQPWRLLHPPALSLPRQPLRPGTRLVPGKAAAPWLTLVSRFTVPESEVRTMLADFFSILLDQRLLRLHGWLERSGWIYCIRKGAGSSILAFEFL